MTDPSHAENQAPAEDCAPADNRAPADKTPRAGLATAAAIAVAVGVCAPLTMHSEGVRTRPYLDPAHVRTVCYGETQAIEDRVYGRDECAAMLRQRLAEAYAPKLVAHMPGLAAEPNPRTAFAALLDASYNAGPDAVVRHFAPLVNSGFVKDACAGLRGWYVTARDRRTGQVMRLAGLVERRRKEARLCLGAGA